ncbi:helix-turn-helix transcriptional regulator [Nocardioides dongxiaopingii]|uniref:winged helix-turn-helix domain-containing protein n=1 Tax=Nocardioides sp. S-1144 TaxID=2582905 RepID=UPI00110E3B7B|nr:helix-turn-helix domain-containing protein [Nocardioides sp. S-1144]QCW50396.1 helix-turn-helix transcriptional regulator [Nocardioides sp. S-1144]
MTEPIETTNATQLSAFAHPMRHRIWREVPPDGITVSQLTHRLATNKGNVAHHVKVLVAAGLLAPAHTRTVRGGTEQYYVRTARRLRLAGGSRAATRAMFYSIAEEVEAAPDPMINHRTIRLTRPQADAVAKHLDRVVNELEPAGEREATYSVLVSVYRR